MDNGNFLVIGNDQKLSNLKSILYAGFVTSFTSTFWPQLDLARCSIFWDNKYCVPHLRLSFKTESTVRHCVRVYYCCSLAMDNLFLEFSHIQIRDFCAGQREIFLVRKIIFANLHFRRENEFILQRPYGKRVFPTKAIRLVQYLFIS